MGGRLSGLFGAVYDSRRREFLGRDGAGWGKLGIFYFFFYLGLAGFFCAMLAVFMALSPRDRPRYYSESSRMATRSNPLSPGLGFRPQPDVEKNIIIVNKTAANNQTNPYVQSLNQYLDIYYPQNRSVSKAPVMRSNRNKNDDEDDDDENDDNERNNQEPQVKTFSISNPGDCTRENQYGFSQGKPCVLVKMNKIVGFIPKGGALPEDRKDHRSGCAFRKNVVTIHCYGEYPADVDLLGSIRYISEKGNTSKCGAIEIDNGRFPYEGKYNRKDVYQAPYVWVQFTKPTPNVLLHVICRAYSSNIDFDKKAGRGLTRFQIYVNDPTVETKSSRKVGEM